MKKAYFILAIIVGLLFLVFAGLLIYNVSPREIKDCVVTINVTAEQRAANGRSVRITQKALEDALRQSAYAARQEAQNEYDKNFSTLLTILTLFGVAWPLVVAFIQHKLNEKEIDKIEYANKKIKDIEEQTKEINSAVATSYDASEVLFLSAYDNSSNEVGKTTAIGGFIISFDHNLNYSVKSQDRSGIVSTINNFFTGLSRINQQAIISAKSAVKVSAKPDSSFVSGKEIKDALGAENIELYRKYRKFFIELYPWKFSGDGE